MSQFEEFKEKFDKKYQNIYNFISDFDDKYNPLDAELMGN